MSNSVSFSVNMHDEDGDVYDNCILIHVSENLIIRFSNGKDLDDFISELNQCRSEIHSTHKHLFSTPNQESEKKQ